MAYQFDSRIRFSEVGPDRRLTMVSLVDYFQDCSTFHSEACGNGIDCLNRYDCVWMILFWQIDILRMPLLGERVITRTWPYGFQAFYGYRNFAMLDENENYLAKANSVWALMNLKTERPMKVMQEVVSGYELEPKLEMEYLPRKISLPKTVHAGQSINGEDRSESAAKGCAGQPESAAAKGTGTTQDGCMEAFRVGRQHLDTNHHVNNSQYIYMAEEYLPENFETARLCVEYRQQARLHDLIAPHVYREDDLAVTVSLCDEKGTPYAIVKNERRM
ncbi:MAG: thioesterase [Lachnospiraceae bacterium]|nr:thioesterase [Lachnospiraceae bacterium]